MKKTIIALATAAVFATSANAATVYEQDGTKVEVGGSVRVLLSKEKDKRADLNNDGSRLEVKANHNLGNGLSALGGLEIRFDDENSSSSFGSPTTNKLFAGLGYEGVGTLTFGKQATNGDDVQLNDNAYVWGGNNNLLSEADKVVKFRSAEWSGFSFGLDYVFGNAEKKNLPFEEGTLDYKYGYQASLFYTRELAQDLTLNLAGGYGMNYEDFNTTKAYTKSRDWRAGFQLVYGPATFGAEYGETLEKPEDVKLSKDRNLLVSASYQVFEPSKLYVQWKRDQSKLLTDVEYQVDPQHPELRVQKDAGSKVTTNTFVVGADYKLHKHVVTYIEYAYAKTKDQSSSRHTENGSTWVESSYTNSTKDNKVGVGLRVFF